MNEIRCAGFTWEANPALSDNRMEDASLLLENSLTCDCLSVDILTAEIFSKCRIPDLFAPADYDALVEANGDVYSCSPNREDITKIPYGTPVEYYQNGELIAKLYKSSVKRTGRALFELSAVSAIGLLDKLYHCGGLYTGQTTGEVLFEIIGSAFEYTVDSDVAAVPVFGWLPYSTRRKNLHTLLFAVGSSVRKDKNGNPQFVFLSDSKTSSLPDYDVFQEGDVNYGAPATGVEVTEHAYYATEADVEAILFDNTDGSGVADRQTVTFDGPCHSLATSGLTLHESGVNYAVVSGVGVLRGLKYTHQTKIVSMQNGDSAGDERIVSVKDCTLVSTLNSANVAQRVLAYYGAAEEVRADIAVKHERPGDSVTLTDSFGDVTQGIIKSMDIASGGFLRATISVITGYVPTGQGNTYNHYAVLTGSGAWVVPAGVKRIKVSVIGGGAGGTAGTSGTDGALGTPGRYDPLDAWITGGSTAGTGGKAGSKGLGGKIFASEISVAPEQSIQFACGTGGEPEADGMDTVFGGLSSASGARNPYGLSNLYTGIVYGADGLDGYNGGDGAAGVSADAYPPPSGEPADVRCYPGLTGQACADGTAGGPGAPALYTVASGYVISACGGSGGGAAFGVPGAAGGSPSYTHDDGSSNYITWYTGFGGGGGNGATPLPGSDGANYGCGGGAGHGGGGGGCPGGAYCGKIVGESYHKAYADQGAPGVGGSGSPGGKGVDGCVLIYY